jgi:hypothetical protein
VTVVEDFEVDLLGEHKPSKPAQTESLSDSGSCSGGEVDGGPPARPTILLKASSSSNLKSAKGASTSSKSKSTTKKRPAYQTKAERKLDKLKQKARREEKMGEGKLRRKMNGVSAGHGGGKGKKGKGGRGKR